MGSYLTAWTWLHKLRRAMVRPGRDRLSGRIEVDETYVGGNRHEVTILRNAGKEAAVRLMPRVQRIAALLKRWLLGTHQGAVSPKHLDYYLDEYTFRFNRRKSRSRGKLFYRLV